MNITDDPPNESLNADRFTYELAKLDRFISKDISSFLDLNCPIDDVLFSDFKQAINEETEKVKDNLINAIFSIEEERFLERYIQYHQRALIRLAGNLLNYVQPENLGEVSTSVTPEVLSQYTYKSLQELLDFIEKHFSKYFDQNAWIPLNYRLIMFQDIKTNIEALKEILAQHGADGHLIHIALLPLDNFLKEDTSNEVTYRRVIYLKELKQQLFKVNTNHDTIDIDQSLRFLLFYLNFNSSEYYNHCIRQLEDICENSETETERINQLALYQKSVYQTQVKPGFILNPSLPSLKKQLSYWIDKEISFHERKQLAVKEHEDSAVNKNTLINIELSVAQLAYFLRILVEIKIVPKKNIAKILRFLTKIFKTDRTEMISYDNIRNRYYKPETGARQAVKNLLLKMLSYINSNQGTA